MSIGASNCSRRSHDPLSSVDGGRESVLVRLGISLEPQPTSHALTQSSDQGADLACLRSEALVLQAGQQVRFDVVHKLEAVIDC
jgi:hypothetical protein